MERFRRTVSREFKLQAVQLVTERGVKVARVAKELDLHENVLRNWVREQRAAPQDESPRGDSLPKKYLVIAEGLGIEVMDNVKPPISAVTSVRSVHEVSASSAV
jgi:transposase-like protein